MHVNSLHYKGLQDILCILKILKDQILCLQKNEAML